MRFAKSKFEDDKVAADLAASKGQLYKRKYQVRTKYLINILTKDNKPAHDSSYLPYTERFEWI